MKPATGVYGFDSVTTCAPGVSWSQDTGVGPWVVCCNWLSNDCSASRGSLMPSMLGTTAGSVLMLRHGIEPLPALGCTMVRTAGRLCSSTACWRRAEMSGLPPGRKRRACRYIIGPALSDERVQLDVGGQVELERRTPWREDEAEAV